MNCDNDKQVHRRLSGTNTGLRRSRSVRASFRLLGSRWKQSSKTETDLFAVSQTDNNKPFSSKIKSLSNSKRLAKNLKLFNSFSTQNKEENVVTEMPDYVPPKAAAILQIPGSCAEFNRNASHFFMNDGNLRILRRSISLKSGEESAQKTATIRRASVWANSTTKISLPDLVTKNSSTTELKSDKPNSGTSPIKKMAFLIPHPPAPRPGNLLRSMSGSYANTNHLNIANSNNSSNMATGNVSNKVKAIDENNMQAINNNIGVQQLNSANKMTKKQLKMAQAQLDKLTKINIHLHALFAAVENGHLDKARTILESTDVDVNSSNSDGLSPLDVAVLSNNRSLTKMLLQYGAVEGSKCKSSESLGNHLNALLQDAENRIHELGAGEDLPQTPFSTRASFSSIIGNAYTGPSVTGCAGSDADKQLGLWERRVKGLRRMLLGWDQARPPDPPYLVNIDVTSVNSVSVRIQEAIDGPISTKFKIQWSSRADFSNIVGEREVNEWNSFQATMGATCRITELTPGRRYFFRVCCGNVKGWGQFRFSIPSSVVPSSWRDMDNKEPRFVGRQRILDELFTAVRLARPDDASEIPLDTPALQRRNPKKKTTIKQLFSAASKFQKNLRRGIYFACILYHEDKVLVTNEDFLPVIEIDETYPSCLHTDYHWLMKVSCTWEDVKSLRTDMDKNSSSATHFRTKLLSAACQMQSALCIQDLGQFFHRPLRDSHGTVVLCCVNNVKSQKCVSVLNSRWIPLNKVQKKLTAIHEDNNINEILLSSIQEQINYHQLSSVKLSKGLYLGYLKMQSSVDQIQVVVPAKTPNVLPHCKIRDNPHVSAEEWDFLKRSKVACTYEPHSDRPTDIQQLFLEALTHAAHQLFTYMNISPELVKCHRLYDIEVIELSSDVSFLTVCPPAESSCAVPGHREILLQRGDLLSLSVQAFEMIHLRTYHMGIIQKYSRLSCILELDTALANHSHREAFSAVEVMAAKERLAKLHDLSSSLNSVWKSVRWLMDVIGFARDRGTYMGLLMKDIFDTTLSSSDENMPSDAHNTSKRQLLQPPPRDNKLVKSSPGRGSWPGPTTLGSNNLLGAEHSKSEQQLSVSRSTNSTRYLSAASGFETPRKNSADSNYSQSGNSYYSAGESVEHIATRLPPSRSEDTLVVSKKHTFAPSHRKRATTVNSSTMSCSSDPVFNLRASPFPSNNDSIHSLSSDSDGGNGPITTSTPTTTTKLIVSREAHRATSNVKSKRQIFETDGVFVKPLPVSGSTSGMMKEPLHISEDDSSFGAAASNQLSPEKHAKRKTSSKHKVDDDSMPQAGGSNSSNSPKSGIIQVYAAYETGLASGTSLKLHVTPKTSAREVVDLVVKQLNMAVVLKGKDGPVYSAEKLDNFCLVAVIGARERCLRDDFKPLQLQNPWKKGRLYVRQKQDLLAAIQHSNQDAHML